MTPSANAITEVRGLAALVCAGLVGMRLLDDSRRTGWGLPLVAGPAMLLDAVDGRVARRLGTASPQGARLDNATDAAMVAVLSAGAASVSPLALLVGAARYLFLLGGRIRPAWRAPLAARPSRRAIGAAIAVLMWLTSVPLLSARLTRALIVAADALALWTFGRDVIDLEKASASRELAHTAPAGPTWRKSM